MDWLDRRYQGLCEWELLQESIHDWLNATGDWRRACRNDVRRRIARHRRLEAAARAALRAAYLRTVEKKEAVG